MLSTLLNNQRLPPSRGANPDVASAKRFCFPSACTNTSGSCVLSDKMAAIYYCVRGFVIYYVLFADAVIIVHII